MELYLLIADASRLLFFKTGFIYCWLEPLESCPSGELTICNKSDAKQVEKKKVLYSQGCR